MFIGRSKELGALAQLRKKNTSSLVVVTGRRRIGKSSLIREFSKQNKRYLEFTGLPPTTKTSKQDQLDEFSRQLCAQCNLPSLKINDWGNAFQLLAKETQNGEVLILLDEITWMGSKDRTFLGKLKNAWDLYLKSNDKLILVICGSVSAWIEKNILSSTGFLGRVSLECNLKELPLDICNKFWGEYKDRISAYEKLKLLAVTGGVPRYLEEIRPEQTAEQNIQNLCFNKQGILFNEFERIFNDLFKSKSDTYKELIKALADCPLELEDIYRKLGKTKNAYITGSLEDLRKSGFVERDYSWNIKGKSVSRLSKFRICDNYIRFYLKYIEPNRHLIEKDLFEFKELSLLPQWISIMGLQFEQLVINNYKLLHNILDIRPVEILSSSPFFQTATKIRKSCQIDYLIHTRFNNLYLCEIKFSRYPIGVAVIEEMQEKMRILATPKGYSVRPILITASGVTEDLASEKFFDQIIMFEEMLG